jgi:hypothetical protein
MMEDRLLLIARAYAEGFTPAQIAERNHISIEDVRRALRRKDVKDTIQELQQPVTPPSEEVSPVPPLYQALTSLDPLANPDLANGDMKALAKKAWKGMMLDAITYAWGVVRGDVETTPAARAQLTRYILDCAEDAPRDKHRAGDVVGSQPGLGLFIQEASEVKIALMSRGMEERLEAVLGKERMDALSAKYGDIIDAKGTLLNAAPGADPERGD